MDHALAVYPLPDALVLADAAPAAAFEFDSCSCLNPVRGAWRLAGRSAAGWYVLAAWCGWVLGSVLPGSCFLAPSSQLSRGPQLPPDLMPARAPALQGSLAAGTFAAYSPVTREAEVCDVAPAAGEEEDEEDAGAGSEEDMVVEEEGAVAAEEMDVAAARDVVGDLEI